MGQYKFKEMFSKKYYGEGKFYKFEDNELFGPENADAILTQMYGDYMTPPPEDKRYGHGAGKLILSFTNEYDEIKKTNY